jgi:hypothetical protein
MRPAVIGFGLRLASVEGAGDALGVGRGDWFVGRVVTRATGFGFGVGAGVGRGVGAGVGRGVAGGGGAATVIATGFTLVNVTFRAPLPEPLVAEKL